jgi:hypothetical protein
MRIANTIGVFTATSLVLIALAISPATLRAQAQGNNVVCTSSTGCTAGASSAFIDASTFTADGSNFCSIVNYIYTNTPAIIPATGAVIDARGLNGGNTSLNCSTTSPWSNVSIPSAPPTTVLLPAATIEIGVPWVLPNQTRLVGEGKLTTIIQPTYTTGDVIDMGSSACPTTGCTGISIEHLDIGFPGNTYTGSNTNNGIVNANAENNSYVDDVSIANLGGTGLEVSAANSGPYTNIAYGTNQGATNPCGTSTSVTGCPVCVSLQVNTRGLHGITCSGDTQTANQGPTLSSPGTPTAAAIQVQASGNSIEDVHTEGFWDGIQVGASSAIGSVFVSNITSGNSGAGGGPVTNTVHICGAHPNTATCTYGSGFLFGACVSTLSGAVRDVAVLDVLNGNGACAATIEDDVTGTTISPQNNQSGDAPDAFTPLYALGEAITGGGHSLFTATPSLSGIYGATNVPTWGSGQGAPTVTPCPTGALFSNTSGSYSLYVCTGVGSASAWIHVTTN